MQMSTEDWFRRALDPLPVDGPVPHLLPLGSEVQLKLGSHPSEAGVVVQHTLAGVLIRYVEHPGTKVFLAWSTVRASSPGARVEVTR